jgi:hypothetical protein
MCPGASATDCAIHAAADVMLANEPDFNAG